MVAKVTGDFLSRPIQGRYRWVIIRHRPTIINPIITWSCRQSIAPLITAIHRPTMAVTVMTIDIDHIRLGLVITIRHGVDIIATITSTALVLTITLIVAVIERMSDW